MELIALLVADKLSAYPMTATLLKSIESLNTFPAFLPIITFQGLGFKLSEYPTTTISSSLCMLELPIFIVFPLSLIEIIIVLIGDSEPIL